MHGEVLKLFKLGYDVNCYRQLCWASTDVDIAQISLTLLPNSIGAYTLPDIRWMACAGVIDLPQPDIAYLQGYTPSIIANEKTAMVLKIFLQGLVNMDSINIEGQPWCVFKIKSYTKSLLLDKCQFNRRSSGRMGRLMKGVYDEALLSDIPFSICKHDPLNIIVNERFVREIEGNGISGLVFKPV